MKAEMISLYPQLNTPHPQLLTPHPQPLMPRVETQRAPLVGYYGFLNSVSLCFLV